ncbi:unnamed protein product [Mytilus coruscus]|uniref:Mutator-like transposase domain-containing protein n=1 Tax=Mytilus coruscus TaxID=42192 RepID=A0A6J8B0K6_MYTCO|nr:unnamed protein product [Mytilus coruscus]
MPYTSKSKSVQFKKGDDDRRQIPVVEWGEKTEIRKKYVRPDAAKTKEESLNDKTLTILKENVTKVDNSKVISVLRPQPGGTQYRTCKLFTRAFHEHLEQSPGCKGNFQFDYDSEEQRTMCWREKVVCTMCKYESLMYPLYEEIGEEGKKGRKAGAPNRRLQIGLADTGISNTAWYQLMRTVSHPAPSRTDMQRQSNESIQQSVVWISNKDSFQPGTQATTTIVENVTARKKIIAVHDANKLCKTASYLRSTGENAICPGHQGHCSANLKPWDSIGNEELYGELLADQLAEDEQPLVIGQITTDGDSHAYRGFSKKHSEVVNLTPENLPDPRHLASTQLRSIDKGRFWCTVEYNFAIKEAAGELDRLVNRLSYVADCIIDCYTGHCGDTCRAYSYICKGTESDFWGKEFLPEHARCLYIREDEENLVRNCMNIRFGRKNLEKTRFGTSTQKCEATNRGYNKSNPKDITFQRNFPARIHSTAHRINHRPGESAVLKCEALGVPLSPNSRPIHQLKREDEIYEYHQLRKKNPVVKHERTVSKLERFELYDEKSVEKETYQKDLLDSEKNFKK